MGKMIFGFGHCDKPASHTDPSTGERIKYKCYSVYYNMIRRVYGNDLSSGKCYGGVCVNPEWSSYKRFSEWVHSFNGWENKHLDKDLSYLCGRVDKREYGPTTCHMIDSQLNYMLVGMENVLDDNSTSGLIYSHTKQTWKARVVNGGVTVLNEEFDTLEYAKTAQRNVKAMILNDYLEDNPDLEMGVQHDIAMLCERLETSANKFFWARSISHKDLKKPDLDHFLETTSTPW